MGGGLRYAVCREVACPHFLCSGLCGPRSGLWCPMPGGSQGFVLPGGSQGFVVRSEPRIRISMTTSPAHGSSTPALHSVDKACQCAPTSPCLFFCMTECGVKPGTQFVWTAGRCSTPAPVIRVYFLYFPRFLYFSRAGMSACMRKYRLISTSNTESAAGQQRHEMVWVQATY